MNLDSRISRAEKKLFERTAKTGIDWVIETSDAFISFINLEAGSPEAIVAKAEWLRLDPAREMETLVPMFCRRIEMAKINDAKNKEIYELAVSLGFWPKEC
jgi:hypothetical protein